MISVFTLLFSLSEIFLAICLFLTRQVKRNFYLYLRAALISSMIMIACHNLILNLENIVLIKTAYCIFYCSTNIFYFSVFEFIRKYTKYKVKLPWFTHFLYICLAVDIITLLINYFTNFEYILLPVKVQIGDEIIEVFKIKKFAMYFLHITLSYLLIILTTLGITIKLIKTPKLYQLPHYSMLIAFLVTVLGDTIWIFTSFPIDFSILFNAATLVLISVCATHFTPKHLLYKQLEEVVCKMTDAVYFFDINGEDVFKNEAMDRLITKYKILGLNPEGPIKALKADDSFSLLKNMPDRDFDESITHGDKIYSFHISTHCLRDKKDNFIGAFLIVHDKTKEVEKLNQELFAASHDSLTGLYNKDGFFEQVQTVLVNNPNEDYLLICSDIDNFKLINDNFGREVGDDFLKKVGTEINKRASHTVVGCRLNGDRFIVLTKKQDFDEELLKQGVQGISYIMEDLHYPVNVHYGIYEIEDITMPIPSMVDRAIMAVDTIKGNLQQIVAHYDDSLRSSILREQQLIGDFPVSLATDQFKMYLQPQVMTDSSVHGAEALVRWQHMKEGIMNPKEFIPLFEQKGLITKLDLYIWDLAAQKLHEWKERGLDNYYISVNISPKDFLHVDIYKTFVSLVERYEIDPKNLKLEITESAIMLNLEVQLELINKLRAYGFIIEMDDFGAGYSSLNLLKDIPFDVLKIDMEFLRATRNTERSISILHSIINLSKCLNMPVITEGVETKEQVDFLKEMGTDYYQGFYFDKPLPVDEFEKKYVK